ncbi:MAG: HAD-IIIA family hydrolase [Brumimicrobium sp.]|nr:HAD-IIIA family hydrolase [Brumimicrobium sp.]MCO5269280.1 HAD-IIIA family hydrolase [Brumimicrobium sp.]
MPVFHIDSTWTLFLDRDGVLNHRKMGGYIESIEEFEFLPHVISGLKRLRPMFARIIIVTNQQGIAKGVYSLEQLDAIHQYMLLEFEKNGIHIDQIYVATNLKGDINDRRKPHSKMGIEAKLDFPEIDFRKSIMVGDTDSDIEFGTKLGMKTVLIKSEERVLHNSDLYVNNLIELANEIQI